MVEINKLRTPQITFPRFVYHTPLPQNNIQLLFRTPHSFLALSHSLSLPNTVFFPFCHSIDSNVYAFCKLFPRHISVAKMLTANAGKSQQQKNMTFKSHVIFIKKGYPKFFFNFLFSVNLRLLSDFNVIYLLPIPSTTILFLSK